LDSTPKITETIINLEDVKTHIRSKTGSKYGIKAKKYTINANSPNPLKPPVDLPWNEPEPDQISKIPKNCNALIDRIINEIKKGNFETFMSFFNIPSSKNFSPSMYPKIKKKGFMTHKMSLRLSKELNLNNNTKPRKNGKRKT
jgi:hypothetical protein